MFQFETLAGVVSPAFLLLILMALSAALPAGLVLYKRNAATTAVPYLEIDVSEAPGRSFAAASGLNR
ncbi:hypothetical protein [Parvularcula lutaonensis]|uniref:Uncharacterized protein n=1 Tax=Parvularcula lutaonensis TaxID=491923 RepID=A0ABV7MCF1_9PROT|nr:hypothetical protein [Parvularcula lutaonensis]